MRAFFSFCISALSLFISYLFSFVLSLFESIASARSLFISYLFRSVLNLFEGTVSASVLQHWVSWSFTCLVLFWAYLREFVILCTSALSHYISFLFSTFLGLFEGIFSTYVLQHYVSLFITCLALSWASLRAIFSLWTSALSPFSYLFSSVMWAFFSLCTSALCLFISYLFSSVLSLFQDIFHPLYCSTEPLYLLPVYLFSGPILGHFSASVLQHCVSLFLTCLALLCLFEGNFQLYSELPLWGQFSVSVLLSLKALFSLCISALGLFISYLFSSILSLFKDNFQSLYFSTEPLYLLPV